MALLESNSTMSLVVRDESFTIVKDIDFYASFIWTDRYRKYGDFEMIREVSEDNLDKFREDYYITNENSQHFMIIEDVFTKEDDQDILTVKGKSGEIILDRRALRGQRTLSGNMQTLVEGLLNEFFISPTDPDLQVSNMIFETSTDPEITALTIDGQYKGSIYEVVAAICEQKDIGFKIILNDSYQFVFSFYKGIDRSGDIVTIPKVEFSEEQENLTDSQYVKSTSSYKNVAIIGGEGEGASQKIAIEGSGTGLQRREVFIEASDISSDGDSGTIPAAEYLELLRQRGREELANLKIAISFEGESNTISPYEYGVDFNTGDIVEISDKWGHVAKTMISEMIMSEDATGYIAYPTFENVA